MNGVLNIIKPTGMTSHDVVSTVRKILETKKVGHAGTLDPNVAGVLVICVGKATKFSDILINGDKEYICEVILGQSTDTGDSYGNIVDTKDVYDFSREKLYEVFEKFKKNYMQTPPAYSAVKYNGKKLYEYARKNIYIEKPKRSVKVEYINLLSIEKNKILIKVKCSKGAYMRTLCEDIAKELNSVGHMGILIRTDAKGLNIKNAITLEELKSKKIFNNLNSCLIPVDKLFPMQTIYVDEKYYKKLIVGNEVDYNTSEITDDKFYIYCKDKLIGLGEVKEEHKVKIHKMLM